MSTTASADGGRGRAASSVGEIPGRGWKDILWRTWAEIGNDHVLLIAAGVTFYGLLALVPALTALVSVYGFFADPGSLDRHVGLLEGLVPADGLELVREQLRRLTEQGRTKLGITSAVALGIALWSANSGMKSMFEAMNVAYDEEEKRSFLWLTVVTLAFTLATIATILLLFGLGVVVPPVLQAFGLGALVQWAVRIGGIVLALGLTVVGLAALYRWGPSRRSAEWRWITPGAVLAIVVIVAASGLFSWYLASFDSYNATYGSLGAGNDDDRGDPEPGHQAEDGAELNSEIEHQTRHDTTTGMPRPMGQRGATMADTLGAAYGAEAEAGQSAAGEPRERMPLPLRLALLAGTLWFGRRRP